MNSQENNSMNLATLAKCISRPDLDPTATYDTKDSSGNSMQCISVIELRNVAHKYAAVYHTPTLVGNGEYLYNINLAVSNDLVTWTYQGLLVSNADMPEIRRVDDGDWIVLVHEQWENVSPNGGSQGPCHIGFKLFYDDSRLINLDVNSTWTAPVFTTQTVPTAQLNGTPNFYSLAIAMDVEGWWYAYGSIGFHYWDGTQDRVGNATFTDFFTANPTKSPSWHPAEAVAYNELFIHAGVTGNIGQRTNIQIAEGRFSLQECNIGLPAQSWEKWRIYSYAYNDAQPWPTGNGEIFGVFPQTPNGSVSFGNPRVSVVQSPNDATKQSIVISYFIFSEGSGLGEAGGLLYHIDL